MSGIPGLPVAGDRISVKIGDKQAAESVANQHVYSGYPMFAKL